MTIDEAIKHCEEIADEKDMQAGFDTDYACYQMSDIERNQCVKCAAEHRQLAEWLKDYKRLKEQEPCEPMVEINLYSVIKQKYMEREVLDKIGAEIEEIETYDSLYIDRAYVLQILDKYKAESEDKENE